MNKYKIVATLRTPNLDLNSLYKVVGRVLLIPINGNGKTSIKMREWKTLCLPGRRQMRHRRLIGFRISPQRKR